MLNDMIFARSVSTFIKPIYYILAFSLFVLLSACVDANEPNNSTVDGDNIYPGNSNNELLDNAYPVADSRNLPNPTTIPESYPPPVEEVEIFQEPRFRIDLPIIADDTIVTGQAPPNLSLAIVDITFNGIILGSGRSNEDGTFSISVVPLPEGHRIGIAIAELNPGQTFNEMAMELFPHRGDDFMNIPNVGVFFDTAMTQP